MFLCELCGKSYINKRSFERHKKYKHSKSYEGVTTCNFCKKKFSSIEILKQHLKIHKEKCKNCGDKGFMSTKKFMNHASDCFKNIFFCRICKEKVSKNYMSSHFRSNKHISKAMKKVDPSCFVYKSAFNNKIIIYRIFSKNENMISEFTIETFFLSVEHCIRKVLLKEAMEKKLFKVRFNLCGIFTRPDPNEDDVLEESLKFFQTDFTHFKIPTVYLLF